RDPYEIGIINHDGQWDHLAFSPYLQDLTGTYALSQLLERAADINIKLTKAQIDQSRENVDSWIVSEIGGSIDTAFDVLNLDREITILDAWATSSDAENFRDVFTDFNEANATGEKLITGYVVSGGSDIRNYCEENFGDFCKSKERIYEILCEKNLLRFVTDLTV
ncbi:hypothetical protein ACTHQ2_24815, partial [Bacillus subtilis]|uniref:hypothetical protein n=1 Tax=Bacillus subtilis TaxID=1423 RepID=UPI003F7BE944